MGECWVTREALWTGQELLAMIISGVKVADTLGAHPLPCGSHHPHGAQPMALTASFYPMQCQGANVPGEYPLANGRPYRSWKINAPAPSLLGWDSASHGSQGSPSPQQDGAPVASWLPSIFLSIARCHFPVYSYMYSEWAVTVTYCHKNAVLQTTANPGGPRPQTCILLLYLWSSQAWE